MSSSPPHADELNVLTAPELPPYRWFASTDPQGKNADYVLLQPGATRRVPLTSGHLERLWSTSSAPEKLELGLDLGGADGLTIPLLRDGKARQGTLQHKAFSFYPDRQTRLIQGAQLIATNRSQEPVKWYYQATVRPIAPAPRPLNGLKGAVQISSEFRLRPGQKRAFAVNAPTGVIDEIQMALDVPSVRSLAEVRLQATWDGEAKPSVDASLLSLLGADANATEVKNAIGELDANAENYRLSWPMPSTAKRQLVLANEGKQEVGFYILTRVRALQAGAKLPPYRFHAASGSARTRKGQPVSMLQAQGMGAFVGLALSAAPAPGSPRRTFAYLEGNETLVADGKIYEGTGTEDFFNSAWYFPAKPFFQSYGGLTYKSESPPRVGAYRLMTRDAVPFRKSLSFAFEHGNGNNSDDLEYRWTAFWYQKPGGTFTITEGLNVAPTLEAGAAKQANSSGNQGLMPLLGVAGLIASAILLAARWRHRRF